MSAAWSRLVVPVLVGLLVATVLFTFVGRVAGVPSDSMAPTLGAGDRVVVDLITWRGKAERGELVVFAAPGGLASIKRVVGLPGETIEVRSGELYVDGLLLLEPYLAPTDQADDLAPLTVADGSLLLLGDNRDNSTDSRHFGAVPEQDVLGRARLRLWPLLRVQRL